jgi:hypothetical protein
MFADMMTAYDDKNNTLAYHPALPVSSTNYILKPSERMQIEFLMFNPT